MTRSTESIDYPNVAPLDGASATNGVTAGVYCGVCSEWVDGTTVDEPAGAIKIRHHYAVHA